MELNAPVEDQFGFFLFLEHNPPEVKQLVPEKITGPQVVISQVSPFSGAIC